MISFGGPTVIPSVRRLRDLGAAIAAPSEYVLLSEVHIGNLQTLASQCIAKGKQVLVQADLIGGFRADRDGIKLLRNMFNVAGVLSQNTYVVAAAKKASMLAIQRVFVMDSRSLDRAASAWNEARPDGIEVLPGAMAQRHYKFFQPLATDSALIAGGMITTEEETNELFDVGYNAITASATHLWERK